MKTVALVVVLMLAGCGGASESRPDWPNVESLYRIEAGAVVCTGPTSETAGPTAHECWWENVLVGGEPACWAAAVFSRPDVSSAWSVSVHRSTATRY